MTGNVTTLAAFAAVLVTGACVCMALRVAGLVEPIARLIQGKDKL